MTQVPAMQDTAYIKSVSENAAIQRVGSTDDPNTLLTLNTPNIKAQITQAAETQLKEAPAEVQESAKKEFESNQNEFASKVTHAFSESLRQIFIVGAVMMAIATVLVYTLKERTLKAASPDATPGEM